MQIVLATSNRHKIREIKEILSPYGIDVLGLFDIGASIDDVEENGMTYQTNALIKARALSKKTKLPVIADDSGLEISSFNNKPGVKTARFAQEKGGHQNAMNFILERLQGKDRSARFVCCIALVDADKKDRIFIGDCNGTIALSIHGNGGFGFDPFFIPEGYNKTFAELSEDIKNKVSHRGKALKELAEFLKSQTT